jgi:plastocyanin domain-containing protein
VRRPGRHRGRQATRIVVAGGYEPDTVYARAGDPLTLIFRREETAACSERVVFPQLGKSAMLPPHVDVPVEVLPPRAATYEFTCHGHAARAADRRGSTVNDNATLAICPVLLVIYRVLPAHRPTTTPQTGGSR